MKISRKIICIMLGLGFAAFGGGAVAGEHQMRQEHRPSAAAGQHQAGQHPGMHAREHNQANRIGQGVRSGQLTKDDARGMAKDQREIRREAREYRADVDILPRLKAGDSYIRYSAQSCADRFGGFLLHRAA